MHICHEMTSESIEFCLAALSSFPHLAMPPPLRSLEKNRRAHQGPSHLACSQLRTGGPLVQGRSMMVARVQAMRTVSRWTQHATWCTIPVIVSFSMSVSKCTQQHDTRCLLFCTAHAALTALGIVKRTSEMSRNSSLTSTQDK